jgi:hypothetical protein
MRALLAALTALAAAWFAPLAAADGLPVTNVEVGRSGVTAARVTGRFATRRAGRDTMVVRLWNDRVLASRLIGGRFTVPAVAYDGSPGGLSRTNLVLIAPRRSFPRASTSFAFVNPRTLELQGGVTLQGDYSYDAISPDGRWLYLIHYLSPTDPLRYEVRAYDIATASFDPKPIVDPREPGEKMNGRPLTRATDRAGRWAYTFYSGGEHPFVHALDTVGRDARCIDLDGLAGRKDLGRLRFSPPGRDLKLVAPDGSTVAEVDLRSFVASPPAPQRRWLWIVLGATSLAVLYIVGSLRRATSTSFGGATSA